jgi:glycosyltransferase involved in cell wall biosynthesis
VTLLEAMACGTPLVVSDLPAFRDVAGHAVFARPRDADRWAEAVSGLIEDPDRREVMTQTGRVIAHNTTTAGSQPGVVESAERATRPAQAARSSWHGRSPVQQAGDVRARDSSTSATTPMIVNSAVR